MSFSLMSGLASEPSFADGGSADASAASAVTANAAEVVPASDLAPGLVGKVIVIAPKSNAKLRIGVGGSSRDEGAPITAAAKSGNGGGLNELFEIVKSAAGTYVIRSAHTGRLVAERDGKVVQTGMTAAADDTQRWAVTKKLGGYIFTNAATASRLSVSGSQVKPVGADAKVSNAQVFEIAESDIILKGYHIFSTPNGNAIALKSASIKNGAGMVLKKDASKTVGRQFFLISLANGYTAMKNSISFKAFSVKGGSKKSGAGLIQETYDKGKNQKFKLVPTGDGWYLLKSALGTYVSSADKAGAKLKTASDKTKAVKLRVRGADYSTGMPKLDAKLKKLRKRIGSKGDTMKKSFKYIVTHYRHREHPNDFSGDWISRYAYYMYKNSNGHCKNFAAAVCVLFRSYGYDARVVTGYVPSASQGWAVHGWVEATVKGKTYIYDADLHVQFHGARGWYQRTYANAPVQYRIGKRW
jgi:hypothetical protein